MTTTAVVVPPADRDPSKTELEVSWRALRAAGVTAICDTSLGELGRIAAGSPEYEPTRYTPAEVRLAWAVLVLRAALLPGEEFGKGLLAGAEARIRALEDDHAARREARVDAEQELREVADSLENVCLTLALPVPDRAHVEGLRSSLPELYGRLQALLPKLLETYP